MRTTLGALLIVAALGWTPLMAAPDHTLGMALLSAVVDSGGNLVRGDGTVSAARLNTGQYEVIFDRDVLECTYVAMVGGAMNPQTNVSVAQRTSQSDGVFVLLSTGPVGTATNTDAPFHLTVFCAR